MNRLGIKYQILLITFIPAFLIDAFFTYSHITSSINQAQEILQNKGRIVSRQISGASEFYLFSGNNQQIQYILDQTVGTDDIVLAAVYNNYGDLIAQSVTNNYQSTKSTEYYYHHQPIMSQSFIASDVFSPDQIEDPQADAVGWVHIYLSKEQLEENKSSIIRNASMLFIIALVMTLFLTTIISRGITTPIFKLIEHLRRVETGHLGELIEPVEYNEIGAVQRGFNRMTQALVTNRKHLNDRIQQATLQLSEAITHLETKNRELGFARDEAQNANRIKSQFLANMSHEIRTPINGIKGFINLMTQSNLTISQKRYAEIILKSTNDLTSIIEEILDFSKLESGKLQIVESDFDLHEIIEQTRDILFINVINKNIDLILIIYSDTPRLVSGDKIRLRQVLLNIIGNAIKFTDEGAVVARVQLEQESDGQVEILITVEDTGIGISEDNQQELFKAFSQVESESNRRYSGTGLGLVISKNLINLMGGDILLSSQLGEGSRFSIQVPFTVPMVHVQESIEEEAPLNALLFASRTICLQEIQSLYDRAGVATQANLIDTEMPLDMVKQIIHQGVEFIDMIVIDLRHHTLNLTELFEQETLSDLRVIVMHYDQSLILDAAVAETFEFISVITTSTQLHDLIYHAEKYNAPSELAEQHHISVKPKHVLLVDDNKINLILGCELIRLWGHEAVPAGHAQEAMQLYREADYDLIILDIQMPNIDGKDLLKMMRDEKPEDRTPIVALTANIMHDEARKLIEHGFNYYLSKPIDEDKLKAILEGNSTTVEIGKDLPQQINPEQVTESVNLDKSLSLCANNDLLLKQIFELLLREIPVYRKQLENALELSDNSKASMTIHKIHGVTCYASLPKIRKLVVDIQQIISKGSNEEITTCIQAIVEELNEIENTVELYLKTTSIVSE